ncbi:MAG: DUF721 domain-containing protein [Candidatus Auribacterota bacterium]|nr:DUF721 domain-containing protein [Candidatus Auribacterota bacterium]
MKEKNEGRNGPEALGPIVTELISRWGLKKLVASSRVFEIWDTVVGPAISLHAQPHSFRDNKLVVNVDSSVWLAQLQRFRARQIKEKLNDNLPHPLVEKVVFRLGELISPAER